MKKDIEVPDPHSSGKPKSEAITDQASSASTAEEKIPEGQAKEIRRLVHDLSNGLEIIIQSSYLLSTSDLPEDSRQWVKLLEQGVQQSARVNQQLRSYIHSHS